ncbi:MAG: TetR family transcriptional regulator [Marinobacter sp.]|uniref:TetR family transcriptional regulator n=1 Tax=Marinobacter sp. TaxID=50741 RepID=UPI00299ED5CA|nr:TetR family transcriptional regulator [Marinobacter sp.]MDX1757184.1 TetR family transcriptional regulator [Marinobacter sp.]
MKGRLCGGRQRARSEQEKAQRETQILDAAEALFSERGLDRLTLADVAAATGLTKAALYRYFRSKELLFLAVYRRALTAFVDDLTSQGSESFPEGMIHTLLAHPVYCRLTAILHVALETGLSTEEAREFKRYLLGQLNRLLAQVQSATGRHEAACLHYLLQCQQALIGCWHMTHPTDTVRDALASGPLQVFQLDFAQTLERHLTVLTDAFLKQPQSRLN